MVKFLPGSPNYVTTTALSLAGNCFFVEIISRISLQVRLFAAEVSLARHFIPERFTACPGTDFAPIFHRGNHGGRMYQGTWTGV